MLMTEEEEEFFLKKRNMCRSGSWERASGDMWLNCVLPSV